MVKPRVLIVTPALADANNGNWHTASRWQRFLSRVAEVVVAKDWDGMPIDAMIALHARRSAGAIAKRHTARPICPIALVLTGTDVYRDIAESSEARHSLQCASLIVVLQDDALTRLDSLQQARTRVILQSSGRLVHRQRANARDRCIDLIAVGHLRSEKDPATLMAAARLLQSDRALSPMIRITHIGAALDPALGDAARRTMADGPNYRWLGALSRDAARRRLARSDALVHMSVMEGGAQVVIEALRSATPVLASRIGGNIGLLGADYDGYFGVGDAEALAALIRRFAAEPAFAERLAAQCALREPLFTPQRERADVRRLLHDLLAGSQ